MNLLARSDWFVFISLQLEQNIKGYVKNLSEVFWFIHQFAALGKEEVNKNKIRALKIELGIYVRMCFISYYIFAKMIFCGQFYV